MVGWRRGEGGTRREKNQKGEEDEKRKKRA